MLNLILEKTIAAKLFNKHFPLSRPIICEEMARKYFTSQNCIMLKEISETDSNYPTIMCYIALLYNHSIILSLSSFPNL